MDKGKQVLKAGGYVRESTDEPVAEGVSLDNRQDVHRIPMSETIPFTYLNLVRFRRELSEGELVAYICRKFNEEGMTCRKLAGFLQETEFTSRTGLIRFPFVSVKNVSTVLYTWCRKRGITPPSPWV